LIESFIHEFILSFNEAVSTAEVTLVELDGKMMMNDSR